MECTAVSFNFLNKTMRERIWRQWIDGLMLVGKEFEGQKRVWNAYVCSKALAAARTSCLVQAAEKFARFLSYTECLYVLQIVSYYLYVASFQALNLSGCS